MSLFTRRLSVATCAAFCAVLFASFSSTEAQQPGKVSRVGFLTTVPFAAITARKEAFRQGLRELGYLEGKNILIEWRSADGREDRLPPLAHELAELRLDIIVSAGSPVTRSLKQATSTIPIVMGLDPDPVGNSFVASLARRGGNVTGLSTLNPEISGKPTGASKGDHSQALPCGRAWEFDSAG